MAGSARMSRRGSLRLGAVQPGLRGLRLAGGLPVHCLRYFPAHLREPPGGTDHAVFVLTAGRVALGAVETEFELFVGSHNFLIITTPV